MRQILASAVAVLCLHTSQAKDAEQRWAEEAARARGVAIAIDYPFENCFSRSSLLHEVPKPLLVAVAKVESNFDPIAVSSANAVGIMQIRWPLTARYLGFSTQRSLLNPCRNIDAGARYLGELHARFDGSWHRALGAYNYGPTRIDSTPLPELAESYSALVLRTLMQITPEDNTASGSKGITPGQARERGFFGLRFQGEGQAKRFLDWIAAQLPGYQPLKLDLNNGTFEARLLYPISTRRDDAERALKSAMGFLPHRFGEKDE